MLSLIEINTNNEGFDKFFKMCGQVSDRQAPRKKKYIRGNQSLFMNRILTKEIMKRAKLRNIFLINRTEENQTKIHQANTLLCIIIKKKKRNYFRPVSF